MKLHYAPTSPYVRKVMIAAHELGVADQFELATTTPETIVADLAPDNPLAQIPTLVLDDGSALYDSLPIIDYLHTVHGGGLIPPAGPERWTCLRRHALGHGLIDIVIFRVRDQRKPEALRDKAGDDKLRAALVRTLDALEREVPDFADGFTIAEIAIVCGLGHQDFRYPESGWRSGRPKLAAWYDGIVKRPSVAATAPREG
jgi:glutathione S-transferase